MHTDTDTDTDTDTETDTDTDTHARTHSSHAHTHNHCGGGELAHQQLLLHSHLDLQHLRKNTFCSIKTLWTL